MNPSSGEKYFGSEGGLELSVSSQTAPRILLPSIPLASSHQAAALTSPVKQSPGVSSGPLFENGTIVLTLPPYFPVNADDDNGSPIANNQIGIPMTRDFNAFHLNKDDPELIPGSVGTKGLPTNGEWSITQIIYTGTGRIALWEDQRKNAYFVPPGPFYVEGTHESSGYNDVQVTFTYTCSTGTFSATGTLTVTPVLVSFTGIPAGGKMGQNVVFLNGQDASSGMIAGTAAGDPGITFNAKVVDTYLAGSLVFIQNVTVMSNGFNGTRLNGNAIGYLYRLGSSPAGANAKLTLGGALPILDQNPNPPSPEYTADFKILENDVQYYAIQADDSPWTGSNVPAPAPQAGTVIDYLVQYEMWVLWKYPDDGFGIIYYPLAHINWDVNFYAQGPGPVNDILDPRGVTASGYFPDNSISATEPPVYNGNAKWVAVS